MKKYNSNFLNTLKERGFIHDCTDFEGLDAYLTECESSGKPGIAYIGFDCTAPSLHAGSLMQIMVLRWLQKSFKREDGSIFPGHKPIVLLGGGTTKIGDPSGKDESRKILSDDDIENNKNGIKKVFEKFIKFETRLEIILRKLGLKSINPDASFVDNDEWLSNLKYIKFLRDFGRYFSVNRMLSMDSVKNRLEREQHLSFLEFNYMILQAYDFVELANKYNCRLQIGGSDQWGNIINGIDIKRSHENLEISEKIGEFLEERRNKKEIVEKKSHELPKTASQPTFDKKIYGLTTPLLTTSSGAKMGKTADGAIWLDAELLKPYDYWQYWRNTDDADVGKFLRLFTELPISEIEKLENYKDSKINEAKIILASEVTKLLHGEIAARSAEQTAKQVFEQGGIGDNLPVLTIEKAKLDDGISIAVLFKDAGLAESNGDAKRLIQGGGGKINDEKIPDINLVVNSSFLKNGAIKLSAGKKKHALIKIA